MWESPYDGSDVTADLTYVVDELFVREDELGQTLPTVSKDGMAVTIEFPNAEGRFRPDSPPDSALAGSRYESEPPLISVRYIRARVETGRKPGREGPGKAEGVVLRGADDAASPVVRALLDWARATQQQVWLSPPHQRPRILPRPVLYDEGGNRYQWPSELRGGVILEKGYLARMGSVFEIPFDTLETGTVAVAESLLADAQWAVWPRFDPDQRRAVVLAASALEVKTPEALRKAASPEQLGLLDVLLKSHEEVPTSVNFQLNELANVIFGESLKDHDGSLAKGIRTLFVLRNDIAHRGALPSTKEARQGVADARAVFGWLDALTVSPK